MQKLITLGLHAVFRPSFITETLAVIGMKGSGKTHTAMVIAEQCHAVGAQIVTLDPVGNHWSLRLDRNGKDQGLPIPVFGGAHGDIPLDVNAGAFVARTLVENHWSAVIDVSRFRKGQRKKFATDFAEELFELKKANTSPLHLILEEARLFVPQQREDAQDPRMLGVFEDIVRIGRNYGIGVTLVDQRPASVNKNVFSQCSMIVAHRLVGNIERRTVADWVKEKDVEEGFEDLEDLRRLKAGECFIWDPASEVRDEFSRIQVNPRQTYDASATPTMGSKKASSPKPLDSTTLAELTKAMAEMVDKVNESDPSALKRKVMMLEGKVARLDQQLANADREIVAAVAAAKPEVVEIPLLSEKDARFLREACAALASDVKDLNGAIDKLAATVEKAGTRPLPSIETLHRARAIAAPVELAPRLAKLDGVISPKQLAMLAAVNMRRPHGATKKEISILSCIPESGHFNNLLYALTGQNLLEKSDGSHYVLATEGQRLLADSDFRPETDIVAGWNRYFTEKEPEKSRLIFMTIANASAPLSKAEISAATGIPESGHFNNLLYAVTGKGVIQKSSDHRYSLVPEFG